MVSAEAAGKVPSRLEKYGEEFMRMFENSDSDREQPAHETNSDPGSRTAMQDDAATTSDSDEWEEDEGAQRGTLRQAPVVVFDGGTGSVTPRAGGRDRRNFLSPRVADVLRAGSSRGAAAGDSDEEALLGSAEFQRMAHEVELLGAAHLDKHEKKKWQARALQQMGAKPAKSPRMPLTIGSGIEKKRKEREAKAFEEDVASGMVRIKGSGAAKRRAAKHEKRREGDRGLKASDGTFRGGVLYVRKETGNPVREGRSGKRKSVGDDFEGDSRKRARKGQGPKSKKKKSKRRR